MKNLNRMLSLALALMMLCAGVIAEGETTLSLVESNPVLATFDGRDILLADADEIAYLLYYYGYVETYPDYAAAIDYLTETAVIEKHIAEAGYDQFSEDEMAAFENEAAAQWEAMLDSYVQSYLTEDTEEARATLREQAVAYYAANDFSQANVLEELIMQEAYVRMEDALRAGYEPSEEEIQQTFEEFGAQYQTMYENDIATYEYSVNYYGSESWYTPEGYRSVLHILMEVEQELLDAWELAQVEQDEAASAETVDEEKVAAAQAKLEAARQAVIDSKKPEIDDIYARLEKGEDFVTLINEYNTDPGMMDAATLEEGYKVHQNSIIYDQNFTKGSFQEQMTQPGTYSEPVVSGFGIHIIYYKNDVPGGLIMTEEIRADIVEYLNNLHMQTAYSEGLAEWKQGIVITVDEEMIVNVTAEVQQMMTEQQALMESESAE